MFKARQIATIFNLEKRLKQRFSVLLKRGYFKFRVLENSQPVLRHYTIIALL
jgi:hypothetical protein